MVGIHVRGIRAITLMLVAVLVAAMPAIRADADLAVVVSDNPRNWTPNVENGQVEAITQVGNTVYIGGTFTSISNAPQNGGATYSRTLIAAFDAATGVIDTTFNPTLDGTAVTTIIPAGGGDLFIAGNFNNVNGEAERKVAKIDGTNGNRVSGFDAAHLDSEVRDLRLVGNELIIGGTFNEVGFEPRSGIASLNATTGALTDWMDVVLAGTHNGGTTLVMKMEVTPAEDRLLIIGNFTSADGLSRNQIAMLTLTPQNVSVSNWATNFYTSTCSEAFNTYMRDLDISEDGSFAVVSTTGAWFGGIVGGVSCDTISRFEVYSSGTNLQPSWVNYTGGDTTYAVEIADGVAYVGGHMRWVNNPYAGDEIGPGAIPRQGIAALDVLNGLPYSWDPGRIRGVGVFDFLVTDAGLWGGSDTERWAGELRERLALFPAPPATGSTIVPDSLVEQLPGFVYHLGEIFSGGDQNDVWWRFLDGSSAGGVTSANGSESWFNARGAFMVNDVVYTGWSDGSLRKRAFDGGAWGSPQTIQLDFGEVGENSENSFVDELDEVTGMFFDPSDGRLYYTRSGSNTLWYRGFTPESDAVGAAPYTANGTVGQLQPNRVRGMMLSDGWIYFANSGNGDLRRIQFDSGTVIGNDQFVTSSGDWRTRGMFVGANQDPTASFTVDCDFRECTFDGRGSSDPDGNIVDYAWDFGDGTTGSGDVVTHTYAGLSTFTVTLTVTDEDGATDSATGQATTTNAPPFASFTVDCDFRDCTFDAGGSSDQDGTVVNYAWDFGDGAGGSGQTAAHTYTDVDTFTVTLTVTDNDGGTDDTTRLATSTNAPPTASFTVDCQFRRCDFDAGASSDDGSIVAYAWDFGDGTNGSGVSPSHVYDDAGEYTITLVVTDNDGATDDATGTGEATNEPPPVHVHDLRPDPIHQADEKWKAVVAITVRDANEAAVEGAVVTGFFGQNKVRSCTTASNGKCKVSVKVNDAKTQIPFTVTNIAGPAGYGPYDSGANHDAIGGDSDGTTIVVQAPLEIHVHDLKAKPVQLASDKWKAKVVVAVRDGAEDVVEGALVTGRFGLSKVRTCTTGSNGKCTVKLNVNDSKPKIPFVVLDVAPPNSTYIGYNPASNHDAKGGDSDGTTIVVFRPPF